ncbi:hypothetical protein BP5796_04694 [Coleophoma crateriformis]|uniref:Uncharacterized protein n=1 Tax=Coleophoma crateriformis TaxID=565419 RepID=A0A3D8SA94_9HELO|nr:hypothetical protein BP5796_04694 [Coleophoma crateriformis]
MGEGGSTHRMAWYAGVRCLSLRMSHGNGRVRESTYLRCAATVPEQRGSGMSPPKLIHRPMLPIRRYCIWGSLDFPMNSSAEEACSLAGCEAPHSTASRVASPPHLDPLVAWSTQAPPGPPFPSDPPRPPAPHWTPGPLAGSTRGASANPTTTLDSCRAAVPAWYGMRPRDQTGQQPQLQAK